MPSSAEIVVEFVRARPELEAACRKHADNAYLAPEERVWRIGDQIRAAFSAVTAAERVSLDRVRGNGNVDWDAVAVAFYSDELRAALAPEGSAP